MSVGIVDNFGETKKKSVVNGNFQASRKLGHIETVMAVMQKELNGATLLTQVLHFSSTVQFLSIEMAAKRLFEQFSILRCSLKEDHDALYFVENLKVSDIPISQTSVANNKEWLETLYEEIDHPLDVSLWRIKAVHDTEVGKTKLIVSTNHAIIDSIGIKVLTIKLLTHLDNVISGVNPKFERFSLTEPLDNFLREPRDVGTKKVPVKADIPYKTSASIFMRKTRWVQKQLTQKELLEFRGRSFEEGIKVHSILGASLCLSAIQQGFSNVPFPLRTAVSLRIGDLAVTDEPQMACYIGVADTPLDINERMSIKEVAKIYNEELYKCIATKNLMRTDFEYKKLLQYIRGMKDCLSFSDGFAITNVDEIYFPDTYLNFDIEDYDAIVNRVSGNFAIGLQVTIQNGNMRFMFVYPEPLIDRESIEAIANRFIENIKTF